MIGAAPSSPHRRSTFEGIVGPAVVVLALAVVWEVAVRVGNVSPYILPAPSRVAEALWSDRTSFLRSTLVTARSALAGFGLAALIGIAVGSLLSVSRRVERSVYPLTLLLQMVPLVAIAPVLVVWLDNGAPAVIASSAIVALFPVIANTLAGLRGADPQLEELFDFHRASAWQRWTRLRFPAAIPSILTGLRIAAGLATIGAVVGEFVAGFSSDATPLGMVITASQREFRTDRVFAAVLLASLVGFVLFGLVSLLANAAGRRMGNEACSASR
ncbi:MAG: ABC transporter permease [Phycisphaerae bacterium]|nr:ABC transporter permease [Phycisphaerae bacterium]